MKKFYKKGVKKLEENLPEIMKGIKESDGFIIGFDGGMIACGDSIELLSILAAIVHKLKENGIKDKDIKHAVEHGLKSEKEIEKELMDILEKLLKD